MNRHQRAVDTNKSVKIGEELTRFVFSLCYALCVSLLCQKIKKKEGTLMARSLMNIRRIITFANRLTVFISCGTRVCVSSKKHTMSFNDISTQAHA